MELTVRPASYVGSDTNSGGWTRSGGAASDWETLRSASDSTYLYDGGVSSGVATSFYTDCIDQDIYNGSPSTISKITVYARAKMDSNATPATIALTERDATGTRQPSELNLQNLTTSWATYEQQFTTHHGGYGYDFGFYPDNSGFDGSELQAGFVVQHGTVGVFVSQLWIVITHEYINYSLTSTPIGLVAPDIARDHKMGRVLEGVIGLNPTTSRNATYGRVFSPIPMAMTGTVIAERNLGTWLVVASADSGSYKTRDGSSWSSAAKSASLDPLPASYLEQFDNRLVVLKGENSGFAYSAKNDPITNWTHKPNFPNQPISFTGLFVGRDASDTPALYFLAEDGVYYLDVFEQFTFGKTELSWEKNSNSGKKGIYFKGATYVAVDRGIYELQGGIALPIGPDQDDGVPVDMSGYVSDLIGVGFWLVISINGGAGSKSTIMKRHIAGKHWHTVYKTAAANSQINTIAWDNGVLYFGEDTNVKSMPLSADSDNVKLLPTYQSQATGALIYPRFHSEFEGTSKVAQKLRMVTEDCDANNYFTAFYKINGAASWTSLGTFATSPRPTALPFGDGSDNVGTEFEDIQFKIEPTRNSSVTTQRPVLVSLTLDYRVVPDVLYKWRFKAEARSSRGKAGQETIDNLTTTLASKPLVKFYPTGDVAGTSYLVEMTALPHAKKGTEFGEEGEYDVEVSQVTD
jgi:hypothetical protein